ncbi:MAG: type I CRISPR-associated protein Cas7 [Ignavibacteriales bacterium]|nr:type I CRISPR-associated protein Cas7 [Ignavibacteriales bacterium]
MNSNDATFNQRCYGLVVVKSEHSNFNADFTGNPRRLPDSKGTIYATDKALKYAIRKFWIDQGKDVFVWKTFKEEKGDYRPKTLEERFLHFEQENPVEVFKDCIDIKFMGITFAMKSGKGKEGNKNLSLTGPLQISYGINRLNENIIYSNQILSPYRDDKSTDSESDSSTLGNESKGLESYYVYDFSLNPKNITNHYEDNAEIQEKLSITTSDIETLKKALKSAVSSLNTTTKIGSENAMLLFITLPENSEKFLPTLKNLVKITKKDEGKVKIDLSEVEKLLAEKELGATIELSYNHHLTEVVGYNEDWSIDKKL